MHKFPRSDSPTIIIATLIGGIIGVAIVLWVLRGYVDKKQLFIAGVTAIVIFIVTSLMRWHRNN